MKTKQLISKVRLINTKGLDVGIEKEFFINNVGEHISFFVKGPNGYNIEFKCFKNEKEVFKSLKKNEVFN